MIMTLLRDSNGRRRVERLRCSHLKVAATFNTKRALKSSDHHKGKSVPHLLLCRLNRMPAVREGRDGANGTNGVSAGAGSSVSNGTSSNGFLDLCAARQDQAGSGLFVRA